MTLLLYIAREYLRMLALCISGFVGLALVIDLFEHARDFFQHDSSAGQTIRYALLRIPEFTAWTIPAAAMMSALITLAALGRRNEIIAMVAGGISRRTIASPVIAIAMLASGFHFTLSEYLVPKANAAARRIMDFEIKKKERPRRHDESGHWFYADGGFLRVETLRDQADVIYEVLLLTPGTPGSPPERLEMGEARWDGRYWRVGTGARRIHSDGTGLTVEAIAKDSALKVPLIPNDFKIERSRSDEANFKTLRTALQNRRRLGQDVRKETVDMHGKLALPLAAVVMTLVSLPFGFRTDRMGNVAAGVVVGIALGFGYFILLAIGLAIGHAGALPPLLAAWLPTAVFGGAGLYLAATLDQR